MDELKIKIQYVLKDYHGKTLETTTDASKLKQWLKASHQKGFGDLPKYGLTYNFRKQPTFRNMTLELDLEFRANW